MAIMKKFTLMLTLLAFFFQNFAQSPFLEAKKNSFNIDHNLKLIVWHTPNIDSTLHNVNHVKTLKFDNEFGIIQDSDSLSLSTKIKLISSNKNYDLYLSSLPVISVTTNQKIDDKIKIPAYFTYFNNTQLIEHLIGLEHRGNTSLAYPKKNYDLEFWTDSLSKKSENIKFLNLRNDDDWILDGLYDEPLLLRSYTANKLWGEIHNPNYNSIEPKAKSGIDGRFVEVFKNNNYLGIYCLREAVDRKLLKLQKNKKDSIRGELFKATSYGKATSFSEAPDFKNIFPHWAGFEMRYPIVDYTSHWDNLYELVELIATKKDQEFIKEINKKIDLNNCIDYYIFINLLYATDNISKNYYLAKYDNQSPYFFVPWDLDGVLGNNPEGKRLTETNQILSNQLFDRLIKLNPENFNKKLESRWCELRAEKLNPTLLLTDIDKIHNRFLFEKIYERNQLLWKTEYNVHLNYNYLKKWLTQRIEFLDTYFITK